VARSNKGRRARSRKRRPSPSGRQEAQAAASAAPAAKPGARTHGARAAGRGLAQVGDLQPLGERPEAPWHPLPLSELLILIGVIGVIFGLVRHVTLNGPGQISGAGAPVLVAGVFAIAIGTIEFALREHRSGYRSHTMLLAVLPPIAVYSIVVLVVAAFTSFPRWLNIPLLLIDAALFVFLWKLLRATFTDARRERRFAGRD
jgi:hypothetical protein